MCEHSQVLRSRRPIKARVQSGIEDRARGKEIDVVRKPSMDAIHEPLQEAVRSIFSAQSQGLIVLARRLSFGLGVSVKPWERRPVNFFSASPLHPVWEENWMHDRHSRFLLLLVSSLFLPRSINNESNLLTQSRPNSFFDLPIRILQEVPECIVLCILELLDPVTDNARP